MNRQEWRNAPIWLSSLVAAGALGVACDSRVATTQTGSTEQAATTGGDKLPPRPPPMHTFKFTNAEGWPPRVEGRLREETVPWRPIPGRLDDRMEVELRRTAEADPRVRRLLGARFAYVSADEVEPTKERPSRRLPVTLTFFSHTANVAVQALMVGGKVASVTSRPGMQPPAGQDEIAAAIALARRNEDIADDVARLQADAMLTTVDDGDPGAGHRVLHVSFSAGEDESKTIVFATVDLTDQVVLDTNDG